MMLSRRLQETPEIAVSRSSTFVRRSTGSNYIRHSNKEQGKKESFVRFSEQQPTLQRFMASKMALATALVIGFEKNLVKPERPAGS
jgi:hypothetical protein